MIARRIRFGKASLKVVLAVATAVSGAITVPTLMYEGEKSSQPNAIVADRLPSSSAPIDSQVALLPAVESQDESGANLEPSFETEATPLAGARQAPNPLKKLAATGAMTPQPSSDSEFSSSSVAETAVIQDPPNSIRVYYATDRHLYSASDPHLWITTFVPGLLVVLITVVLIAGMFAGKQRVWWGIASLLGIGISYLMVGNAIIRGQALYRLAKDDGLWFSSQRMKPNNDYPLNLGSSLVSIPKNHREGQIEAPSAFTFELEERADKHILIRKLSALKPDEFFSEIRSRIQSDSERSALVFIHGYNVAFDEGLKRTAQLKVDLDFAGVPILYSWPSRGTLAGYVLDQKSADWSADHLQQFLVDIRQRTDVKKFHIIAHSMGNRALVAALETLGLRYPKQQPMFEQVVLAAPDVDAEQFQTRFASKIDLCSTRVTVYGSATDRALLASNRLNGQRRLGLNFLMRPTVEGIDFVDVTPIDTSLLGHSYYGNHPLMIQELKALFRESKSPETRSWLTQKDKNQKPPIWRFLPELSSSMIRTELQIR